MLHLLETQHEALKQLCQKYGVKELRVFGSAARADDFDPDRSDVDFLVTFHDAPPGGRANAYFGLLFALETLLKKPVDLVEQEAVKNPYVKRSIEAHQQTLYASA
jgi:uncharacterized protein